MLSVGELLRNWRATPLLPRHPTAMAASARLSLHLVHSSNQLFNIAKTFPSYFYSAQRRDRLKIINIHLIVSTLVNLHHDHQSCEGTEWSWKQGRGRRQFASSQNLLSRMPGTATLQCSMLKWTTPSCTLLWEIEPDKFPETRVVAVKPKSRKACCKQVSHQYDLLFFVATVEVTGTGFYAKTCRSKVCWASWCWCWCWTSIFWSDTIITFAT